MINDKRPSLKFFAAGMVGLMIAPLIMLLGPPIFIQTMYFDKGHVVLMTPLANFVLFGIAFTVIIVNLFLLAWKRNKIMYSITVVVLMASIGCGILSTKSYTAINHSGLIITRYGEETHYNWSDFKNIDYYYDPNGGLGVYEFTLNSGEIVTLEENGQFISEVRGNIYNLARQYNIYVKEQEKK